MSCLTVQIPALPVGWSRLSGSGIHLVLGRPPEDPLVAQLRESLSADQGRGHDRLDDLLDVLLRAGVRGLPDFVAVEGLDPLRLVVRGAPVAEVTVAGKVRSIVSCGARTWADVEVSGNVELVSLRLPPAGKTPEPEPAVPVSPLMPLPRDRPADDREELPSYDDLFGSTQRAMAFHGQDEPVAPPPTVEPPSPPPPSVEPPSPPVTCELTLPAPQDGSASGQGGPGASGTSLPAPAPVPVTAQPVQPAYPGADDHDKVRPTVPAVLCPVGHPSPPHGSHCRLCGREIPNQQPRSTARPALGILRLSSGDVVNLDRGVLLGRAPKGDGDPTGPQRPHVLRLASPDRHISDISRDHAEVLLEGWQVMVRDLGSTNGTTVALPGQEPIPLRPNEQQVIEPGTVVTLADEVSFTYEVQA